MLSNFVRDEKSQAARVRNIQEAGRMLGNLVSMMENDRSLDLRWVAIAKTDLQRGFMALERAVLQPDTF